jgi:hypothetical protein
VSRVFVVHNAVKDQDVVRGDEGAPRSAFSLAPARRLGDLVHVFPPCPAGRAVAYLRDARVLRRATELLSTLGPDDYLLPAGHPALMCWAGATALSFRPTLRVLAWDRAERRYDVVRVAGPAALAGGLQRSTAAVPLPSQPAA